MSAISSSSDTLSTASIAEMQQTNAQAVEAQSVDMQTIDQQTNAQTADAQSADGSQGLMNNPQSTLSEASHAHHGKR